MRIVNAQPSGPWATMTLKSWAPAAALALDEHVECRNRLLRRNPFLLLGVTQILPVLPSGWLAHTHAVTTENCVQSTDWLLLEWERAGGNAGAWSEHGKDLNDVRRYLAYGLEGVVRPGLRSIQHWKQYLGSTFRKRLVCIRNREFRTATPTNTTTERGDSRPRPLQREQLQQRVITMLQRRNPSSVSEIRKRLSSAYRPTTIEVEQVLLRLVAQGIVVTVSTSTSRTIRYGIARDRDRNGPSGSAGSR